MAYRTTQRTGFVIAAHCIDTICRFAFRMVLFLLHVFVSVCMLLFLLRLMFFLSFFLFRNGKPSFFTPRHGYEQVTSH